MIATHTAQAEALHYDRPDDGLGREVAAQISVNQLKNWSRCKKKFYYESVKKLRWPSDPSNFRLGQAVHKLLDYQARGLDCQHLLTGTQADIRQSWQVIASSHWVQLPIIANEWGFTVPLSTPLPQPVWLVGRVDRIAQMPSGHIAIIDWKTGTAVPKDAANAWQTLVYWYAIYEARTVLGLEETLAPEQFQFVYVEVREQVRAITLPYSAKQHASTQALLQQTITEMLSAEDYPLPARCPDRFCPYRSICGIEAR
ncbi:MAG: PD-(D/E)XK nuclease family protein [Candidatus Melainabacteria bacterium]|nr:PD-(D/E)XK nuclease family protein [Candidatus Melainabacteria bacterium]